MEDKIYQDLTEEFSTALGSKDNLFEEYGFLRNPFPKAGEPTSEPLFNQADVQNAFLTKFKAFVQSNGRSSDRMFIHGDHRVGKTNFLGYWRRMVTRLIADGFIKGFIPIYLTIASDNFIDDIHKPMVLELNRVNLQTFFESLLKESLPESFQEHSDFRRAVVATVGLDQQQGKLFVEEERIRLFTKWFSGAQCNKTELKQLGGVFARIDTSSFAIKCFQDFITLAKQYKSMDGIILLIDEFELIFSKSVTPSKRARYLQDLRHFLDTLQEGLFIVTASTSGVLSEFQRDYPALKSRFGDALELKKIQDTEEAKGYAQAYIDFGREAFRNAKGIKKDKGFKVMITEAEIETIYEDVAKKYGGAQGWFFAQLHEKAETKITK